MYKVGRRVRSAIFKEHEGIVVCVLFRKRMFQVEWDVLTCPLPTIYYNLTSPLIETIISDESIFGVASRQPAREYRTTDIRQLTVRGPYSGMAGERAALRGILGGRIDVQEIKAKVVEAREITGMGNH
jgi:hypothetical protein